MSSRQGHDHSVAVQSDTHRSRIRKIDAVLRAALWEAHGAKCAYDRKPIENLDNMEVDHVLPELLWRNRRRLGPILAKLDLSRTYHPNTLDNLLPARRGRNRQKGDWVFDESSVRFYRGVAARHAGKVEQLCQKYERDAQQGKIRARLEAMCAANGQFRRQLVTALAKTPPFPVKNFATRKRAVFSRPRVKLDATLPNGDHQGSVTIQINTLYLHAVQFTFEAIDVLTTLLSGWGTAAELAQRAFVLSRLSKRSDEWIVSLNGATILLTLLELQQLCEVVDLLAPRFLDALLKRERADGTLRFAPDVLRNARLLRVKRALWREIQEFARPRDFANGQSRWHIFDVGGWGHIKIVRRRGRDVLPFDTYVYSCSPEREFSGPNVEPEDEVYLCWDESESRTGKWNGLGVRAWTAEQTFHWLTEKLIPEVLRHAKRRHKLPQFEMWRGKNDPPRYFSDTFVEDHTLFEFEPSWAGLAKFADAAQVLYINHSNEPVQRSVVESALDGVRVLADTLPVAENHLNYIATKIRSPKGDDVRQIIATGADAILAADSFTARDVDHILRCAHAMLADHATHTTVSQSGVPKVVRKWRGLIHAARQEAIRHRTIERLRQPEYR